MAKTSFPYVIVWERGHAGPDVLSKNSAWCAHYRFDLMKLFRTLESAEKESFRIVLAQKDLLGEVNAYRFDVFLKLFSKESESVKRLALKFVRQHGIRGGSKVRPVLSKRGKRVTALEILHDRRILR